MRNLSLLLILLTICSCDKTEIKHKERVILSDEAINHFKEDAYFLTQRTVFQDTSSFHHHYKDSLKIPLPIYYFMLKNLGLFYDKYDGPEKDTILGFRDVHTRRPYVYRDLLIKTTGGPDWVDELKSNQKITTADDVKAAFDQFGIQYVFSYSNTVEVKADSSYNLVTLRQKLEELQLTGIDKVYTNAIAITGFGYTDITIDYNLENGIHFMNFKPFYGAPWRYKITEEEEVIYLGR